MILADGRDTVIENIKIAAESGKFHAKVEVGDPVLTPVEEREITSRYLSRRDSLEYKLKSAAARCLAAIATKKLNRDTEFVGLEKLEGLRGGAIITANHFSPTENTAIRAMTQKLGKRLFIVSQVSNFAMTGPLGFLMNYADTIPISKSIHYQRGPFADTLSEILSRGDYVLIYPEAEMWFNYRKPRPSLSGAYYYAASIGVPVISCFTEIIDTETLDTDAFHKVKYKVYILDVIDVPSVGSAKDRYTEMQARDDALKRDAYERIYKKPLDYTFDASDIAGYIVKNGNEN